MKIFLAATTAHLVVFLRMTFVHASYKPVEGKTQADVNRAPGRYDFCAPFVEQYALVPTIVSRTYFKVNEIKVNHKK